MKNLNCPNCGAPIDIHSEKCAYCDTPYETSTSDLRMTADEIRFNVTSIAAAMRTEQLYRETIDAMRRYSTSI